MNVVAEPACSAGKTRDFSVIFVTGLSGAGKSTVLNVFEDMNYFTLEGLPATLIPDVTRVLNSKSLARFQGLVIGVNLLELEYVKAFEDALVALRRMGVAPGIIFLEAKPSVITTRYATTRRPHPLEREGLGLEQAMEEERERIGVFRDLADLVIDTSEYSIHDLRRTIQSKWRKLHESAHALKVHLISFGFKYGMPSEADMVFDLRFLPNPYFVPDLKPLSGLDAPIAEYVLGTEQGKEFLEKLLEFLQYQIPFFETEGRYRLTIAIGCTGGRHRSVAVTEALACAFKNSDYTVSTEHRHLHLDSRGRA